MKMTEISTKNDARDKLFEYLVEMTSSHKANNKKFAVLLINLNNFRQFNVSCGYKMGDKLLNEFATRLISCARTCDYLVHVGNADFIMVLPDVLNEGHATLASLKLQEKLVESFELGSQQYKLSADIGISLFPDHADEVETLLQAAEKALLDARQNMLSYAVYSNESKKSDFNCWDIETELQKTITNNDFELYYQPQICMQTGVVFGAEALIRWKHEKRGFIRPDVFIPIAESNGQIHEITQWTINTALRQIKEWPSASESLKIAINLSAKVLKDPELVDSVRNALLTWNTEPSRVMLEVTESALMDDVVVSFNTLNELRALGVSISIDDFGTGYSSMAYFKNIPASELKIDQSFVTNMLENDMDRQIVKTIIKMAQGFKLQVVAEGIENDETFEIIKELGCDIAQGYLFAKPMPQKEFLRWIDEHQSKE